MYVINTGYMMTVTMVVADDNDTFSEIEYQREQVSQEVVALLVQQLDGRVTHW